AWVSNFVVTLNIALMFSEPGSDSKPSVSRSPLQFRPKSKPLISVKPVLLYDTSTACRPPDVGLRVMRAQAGCVRLPVGLVDSPRHSRYTVIPPSTAIMSSILIEYQSRVDEKPDSNSLLLCDWKTKPAVSVVASSGCTCGLPTALTNHSADEPLG